MQGNRRPDFFLKASQKPSHKVYMIIGWIIAENPMGQLLELCLILCNRSSLLQGLQCLQLTLVLIFIILGEQQLAQVIPIRDAAVAFHGLKPSRR